MLLREPPGLGASQRAAELGLVLKVAEIDPVGVVDVLRGGLPSLRGLDDGLRGERGLGLFEDVVVGLDESRALRTLWTVRSNIDPRELEDMTREEINSTTLSSSGSITSLLDIEISSDSTVMTLGLTA